MNTSHRTGIFKGDCERCLYPEAYCKCTKDTYARGTQFSVRSDKPAESAHGPGGSMRTFNITFPSKEGHPWAPRIYPQNRCIAVNGIRGADIHLNRGHSYVFNIHSDDDKDSFYFTEDCQGGPIGQAADSPNYDPAKLVGTSDPVSSGKMIFEASLGLPKTFYYQSRQHRCMGGVVFIHDN